MSRIFIAGGHGGNDPGAVGSDTNEKKLAMKIIDEAEEYLKNQELGKDYVRVPDKHSLIDEVSWINKNLSSASYDLAINVHFNSNAGRPGTGIETWYGLKELADEVQEEIVGILGLADRGVKENNLFYFNRVVKCASCILEMGFINNSNDVETIRKKGGLALAKAIVRATNREWKEPTTTTTTSTSSSTTTTSLSTSSSTSSTTTLPVKYVSRINAILNLIEKIVNNILLLIKKIRK